MRFSTLFGTDIGQQNLYSEFVRKAALYKRCFHVTLSSPAFYPMYLLVYALL